MTRPASESAGILAVGAGSFFARRWAESPFGRRHVRFVHHQEIGTPGLLDGVGAVVSFVRPADYDVRELAPEEDANTRIARWLAPAPCHFVLLSSRQVYGDAPSPLREDQPARPHSTGARNRLATEHRALDILGQRLTILRCANLFGFELLPGRSRFMAVLLRGLLQRGQVELSVSGRTERDFLPDCGLVDALTRVVQAPQPGIFNLGSGVGTALADLAGAVIRGFGRGELLLRSDEVVDPFVLDMSRWNEAYGTLAASSQVLERAEELGCELRRHSS